MTFSWYPLLATWAIACLGRAAAGRIDRVNTDRDDDAIEAVERRRTADLIIVYIDV